MKEGGGMLEERNKGGRPALYDTPQELLEKAREYFEEFAKPENEEATRLYGKKPTITGLILHLGFCDRHSFYDYEKRKGFSHTIKYLRTMIENVYESRLAGPNVTGVIFALKNLGWKDTPLVDNSQHTHITFVKQALTKAKDVDADGRIRPAFHK